MSWKLGDTELVVRKGLGSAAGGGGANVSMRWDYRREFELEPTDPAAGTYTLNVYKTPEAFEGVDKVPVEQRDAERMRRGLIGPLPNQANIEPGSSLVISEGTKPGEFHLVPVQLDRLPAGKQGFQPLPPVDVRDLDSWVGRQVHVIRRLQSFRGRLLAASPELVIACPGANGKEKITRLKDYESISTAQDADFGQHTALKPGDEGKIPQGQIRLALVHPATHLHVHFGLKPAAIGWGVAYTAILNQSMTRMRLFRAQADIYNRTGYTFRAVPRLVLKASPEAPARTSGMPILARFQARSMMLASAAPESLSMAGPRMAEAGDGLAGRLQTTYEVPLPGSVLPPSKFRADGREIPYSTLLFSDRRGIGVDPFFLVTLDMWTPTTAADSEQASAAELNLRLRNGTEHDWVAGPLRIFASEDFRSVRFVGAARLPDTKAAGGAALIPLLRSGLISFRANIQVTNDDHPAAASAPAGVSEEVTTPPGQEGAMGSNAGGSVHRTAPVVSGGAVKYTTEEQDAKLSYVQTTPRIVMGKQSRLPCTYERLVQRGPGFWSWTCPKMQRVDVPPKVGMVVSAKEPESGGTARASTETATMDGRTGGQAQLEEWVGLVRTRTAAVELVLENADDKESLPIEVQGDLDAEYAVDFPSPPTIVPLTADGAVDTTREAVELSRANVGRKGRTVTVRVPGLPAKSRAALRFSLAYDAPLLPARPILVGRP